MLRPAELGDSMGGEYRKVKNSLKVKEVNITD